MKNNKDSFRKFLIIWFGELISSIGSGLSSFGLGVYVYTETGLASATALVTLCGFLPSVLLNPITGVLTDRYDRRLLMIIGDSLSATGLIYSFLYYEWYRLFISDMYWYYFMFYIFITS